MVWCEDIAGQVAGVGGTAVAVAHYRVAVADNHAAAGIGVVVAVGSNWPLGVAEVEDTQPDCTPVELSPSLSLGMRRTRNSCVAKERVQPLLWGSRTMVLGSTTCWLYRDGRIRNRYPYPFDAMGWVLTGKRRFVNRPTVLRETSF